MPVPVVAVTDRRDRVRRCPSWHDGRHDSSARYGWTAGASACGCCTCTRTPTTSRARARRRRPSTSPKASRCWSPPAPGASGARSSTRRWTGPTCWPTSARSAARRWIGRGQILGIQQVWLGFVDSGLPEGDPLPPLPDGCFALMDLDVAAAPLIKVIRDVPAARDDHVRRERRLSAPRPHHVPQDHVSPPSTRPPTRTPHPELGTPWQPLKLYYSFTFHRDRMVALDQAMISRGLESPYAERLRDWPPDPDHAARMTTRVRVCGVLRGPRPGAAGPRDPGRPGGPVVLAPAGRARRGLAHRGLGTGPQPWCRSACPRTTCSPGSPCRPRVRSSA